MTGTRVEMYFQNREKSIVAYVLDATPEQMKERWGTAVACEWDTWVFTDKNDSVICVHPNRLELFVCTPWNGV